MISAALNLLTPEKANLLLLSPEHEGQCPLREKWFGTQYSLEGLYILFYFQLKKYNIQDQKLKIGVLESVSVLDYS